MILPHIAIAVTGLPAAYRSRGALRFWIAYEVIMALALKAVWEIWHVYAILWAFAEPVGLALAAAAILQITPPRAVRVAYALPALAVYLWVLGYPERWENMWLQTELHLVAFACLVLSCYLIPTIKDSLQVAAIFALLTGTAIAYLPMPWHMDLRPWLMYWDAGCYAVILASQKRRPPTGLFSRSAL